MLDHFIEDGSPIFVSVEDVGVADIPETTLFWCCDGYPYSLGENLGPESLVCNEFGFIFPCVKVV